MVIGGDRSLYWKLTAEENLDFFASLYGISKKDANKKIDEVLEYVGLTKNKNHFVETFSKGMKQRLLIAKALINDPLFLILDEPTNGLDIDIAFKFHELIKKLNKEKNIPILLTTHNLSEVEKLCNRVGVLHNGFIEKEGTISELKSKFGYSSKVEFVGSITETVLELLAKENFYYKKSTDNILRVYLKEVSESDSLLAILSKNEYELQYMSTTPVTLEDIIVN